MTLLITGNQHMLLSQVARGWLGISIIVPKCCNML